MITKLKRASNKGRILWFIFSAAALAGTAGYFYLQPEFLPEWAAKTSIGRGLQTTTVYKWQDPSGAWHVSDTPPPANTQYSVQDYAHGTNVLPLPPTLQQ